MGYPQFNLTTLQLPAPAANMTKAEYKAAYGIDLDAVNIKAFKLVLFGGEKYAIDQIKEIEDGYEIYFNGHILSITDIVQTSDEVYDVANSKPLYYHPIFIQKPTGDLQYALSFIIINNNPTAFTFSSFKNFIDNLGSQIGTVRMNASGGWSDGETVITSVALLAKTTSSDYIMLGFNASGKVEKRTEWNTLFGTPQEFTDGVNKLN